MHIFYESRMETIWFSRAPDCITRTTKHHMNTYFILILKIQQFLNTQYLRGNLSSIHGSIGAEKDSYATKSPIGPHHASPHLY